jgi:hypothetical protein
MNLFMLAVGLFSVYFGYRLFCSISRRSLSMISGAALAIFGMAVLVGQAKGLTSHRAHGAAGVHSSPNWHNGSVPSHHGRAPVEFIA